MQRKGKETPVTEYLRKQIEKVTYQIMDLQDRKNIYERDLYAILLAKAQDTDFPDYLQRIDKAV